MFQDYCSLHGNPCSPGSLYCCDECKNEDIMRSSKTMNILISPLSSRTLSKEYLLYECWRCDSLHDPFVSCKEAKEVNSPCFTLKTDQREEAHQKYYHPRYDDVEIFKDLNLNSQIKVESRFLENEDSNITTNNRSIKSNYRAWLTSVCPR